MDNLTSYNIYTFISKIAFLLLLKTENAENDSIQLTEYKHFSELSMFSVIRKHDKIEQIYQLKGAQERTPKEPFCS